MASRSTLTDTKLGLAAWLIFSAVVPVAILLAVCVFSAALPWVKHPYLANFGTGDAILLGGLLCVTVSVETLNYIRLSNYRGTKITIWNYSTLGVGVVFLVMFGACKFYGLYALSDDTTLTAASNNLVLITTSTLVSLVVAITLGVILKVQQLDDTLCMVEKRERP
jgi:hypothetical protein